MTYNTIKRLAKYNFLLIRPIENFYIKKWRKQTFPYPPVFIIGAPRSGSTILYQLMTNTFDVLYINNLIHYFHRTPVFGFWLSHHFLKNKVHRSFKSDFGNTEKSGLAAPSESGQFWYRFIPKELTYINKDDLHKISIQRLKNVLSAITNHYEKPILFKNLFLSQRLRLINAICPESKIVIIKRDPFFNTQSIYLARKKLKIKDSSWWSVRPDNYKDLQKFNLMEQLVAQIYYIEEQMEQDKNLFNADNVLTVSYENLCNSTQKTINQISECLSLKKRVLGTGTSEIPNLEISESIKIDSEKANQIKTIIKKYDFKR